MSKDLLENALGGNPQELPEKLNGHSSSDGVSSATINLGSDSDVVEETFGVGATARVLLVTKGISLKNIVKASK